MFEKSLSHNGAFSVNLKHLCTFFAGCLVFHLCNDEVSLLRGAELLDWHCPWEMICSSWIRNHVTMKERIIIVSRMHYFDFGKQHWIVWNPSFLLVKDGSEPNFVGVFHMIGIIQWFTFLTKTRQIWTTWTDVFFRMIKGFLFSRNISWWKCELLTTFCENENRKFAGRLSAKKRWPRDESNSSKTCDTMVCCLWQNSEGDKIIHSQTRHKCLVRVGEHDKKNEW